MQVQESNEFCLVGVCLAGARRLAAREFQQGTADAYRAIQRELSASQACYPVRLWNYLPDIHAPSGDGTDRYMSFNAGRFETYSQWLGGAGTFDRTVPTASAVGHEGDDLIVHALGSRSPGIPVINPRQISPHRYSRRFGPLPPCFARATILPAHEARPARILVGGTASIRGEESIHLDDLVHQTRETFDNLAYLIRAALATEPVNGMGDTESRRWLSRFRELRIYYVRQSDLDFIKAEASRTFSESCRIELVRADLCRAELLIEIEGMAEGNISTTGNTSAMGNTSATP